MYPLRIQQAIKPTLHGQNKGYRIVYFPQTLSFIHLFIQQAFVDQLYMPDVVVGAEDFEMDKTDGVHVQMEFILCHKTADKNHPNMLLRKPPWVRSRELT